MFLATNPSIEAFFWIVIFSLFLVSLTIFLGKPTPPAKEPKDFSVTHHLEGKLSGTSGEKSILEQMEITPEGQTPDKFEDYQVIEETVDNRYTFAIVVLLLIVGSFFMQSAFDVFKDDILKDSDNDGLTDVEEIEIGTDPLDSDSDDDGLDDGVEVNAQPNSDPMNNDTDDDGLTDYEEVEIGTDATDPDSDGDGLTDHEEIEIGTNATDPDSDGDGLSDYDEIENGTDPIDDQVGNSLYFDGAENYVYIGDPDDGSLDFGTGAFSYSLWVKTTEGGSSKSDGGQILCKRGDGGNYEMHMHKGGYVGANHVSTASTLDDGEWHNIVFTHESKTVRIYVDGQWEASGLIPDEDKGFSSNGPLHIGADSYQGENFRGNIDEVAFWNTRLSSSEIFTLYHYGRGLDASINSGDYTSSSNLAGYWKFVENHGTEVADASPNNNVGTIYGADWSTDSPKRCELVPYGRCSAVDLVGRHLSGMNLTGIKMNNAKLSDANLSHADLTGANLKYADLRFANLSGANLRYADLTGVNLTHADLTNADLTGVNLNYANLTTTDLYGADLTDTTLGGANLTDANLKNADLTNAYLLYADLSGSNLMNADLTMAILTYADLTNANLIGVDLYNAELFYADLSGANLTNADLTMAILFYAVLRGADLGGANLTDAKLESANLTFANLTDAIVTDAVFTDTYWEQTIWTDGVRYDENQA